MSSKPLALVLALVVALTALASLAAGPASAATVRHKATGFSAKLPPGFAAHYRPAAKRYVIASRRRGVAVSYQRIATRRPPRVAGRLLARRAGAPIRNERAGRAAYRAVLANGRVVRVRRAGRASLAVTRFSRRAWSGDRHRLLAQIVRGLRGGRRVPLPRPAAAPPPQARPDEPTQAPGDLLFSSDFETGTFAGWYVQSLRERATIVPGAFGSRHAARFEVRDGDDEPDTGSERSEISLSGPRFREGQELYFRDTFRVPRGSSIGSSWQIINQLHESDWGGSPGIATFLKPGPTIEIGAGDGSPTFLEGADIEYDRWHDLVFRTKLSRDEDVGFVEVWLDGKPLPLGEDGATRSYGQTIQAPSAYLKAGIYRGRSHTGTSVVEHDNLSAGTSLEAVDRD